MKGLIVNHENNEFVDARKMHYEAGIKTEFAKWVKRKIAKNNLKENRDYLICYKIKDSFDFDFKGKNISKNKMSALGITKEYLLDISIAILICDKTKRAEAILKYIYDHSNMNNMKEIVFIKPERRELEFIGKLKEALRGININEYISQYRCCNKYRIDLYLPELNIAIEYDEDDHKNYTYEQHEGRQKEIEQELGCKFIRVSDENSDEYNIGYIIKVMFDIKNIA